ncbi:uncharacterized protein LOC143646512 [Tamandua tetradactyla]|uniref:uncharacterized protein LOC143646512 n=1 Tax=Tamandua tetradactyla TaxID=48850 RepID=UPI00405416A5
MDQKLGATGLLAFVGTAAGRLRPRPRRRLHVTVTNAPLPRFATHCPVSLTPVWHLRPHRFWKLASRLQEPCLFGSLLSPGSPGAGADVGFQADPKQMELISQLEAAPGGAWPTARAQ